MQVCAHLLTGQQSLARMHQPQDHLVVTLHTLSDSFFDALHEADGDGLPVQVHVHLLTGQQSPAHLHRPHDVLLVRAPHSAHDCGKRSLPRDEWTPRKRWLCPGQGRILRRHCLRGCVHF